MHTLMLLLGALFIEFRRNNVLFSGVGNGGFYFRDQ